MAISVAVCEIFSVKEWCDLENRVRVRSGLLEIAPFDRPHTSSYSPFIVTMALYLYRLRDIATYWSKIAKFLYPTCIYRTRRGWPCRNFVKMFDADKTKMIGLPYCEKNYDDMLSRFDLILKRHGQTHRHTDGRTELLYQYRASVCWRAIKIAIFDLFTNVASLVFANESIWKYVHLLITNSLARKISLSYQNCTRRVKIASSRTPTVARRRHHYIQTHNRQ